MNDIILSGLLNLFALYNSGKGTDHMRSTGMISDYLTSHCGLKNITETIQLYRELLELYRDMDEVDRSQKINSLIGHLKGNLTREERLFVTLRVMEVLSLSRIVINPDQEFRNLADGFEMDGQTFSNLLTYISDDGEDNNVKSLPYGNGVLRLLYVPQFETLVFSSRGDEKIWYNDIQVTSGTYLVWQGSGVVRCSGRKPLYRYNAMAVFRDSEPEVPSLKLRGSHIDFRYPEGDVGIHDFSFNLYGGELVAIMGGSGTGKSTLLSLLNGSLMPQKGSITVNGHPISDPHVKSLIGFVPQDDLLIEELTVYQNLLYTARLCFDGMRECELQAKVNNVLRELGLDTVSHLKVGSPLNKYISGGQRKRLNIALELIREPNVLFLDEPTSGLSSSDTMAVINLLRVQAYKGKLVVTNIHQPSSDVFKMFDRLWVLDTGGYPVYDGNPVEALTYFKKAARIADEGSSVCPMCGNIDSETILSILEEKVIDHNGFLTDRRKRSPEEWNALYHETISPKAKDKVEAIPPTNQQRPPAFKQMWLYLKRNARVKLTDRQWVLITLLEAPVLALVCALLTHYSPLEGYSVMDNKNLVSYMFMAIIVATFLGMSGSAEEIIKDRSLLKREKYLNLSYGSYIGSKIIFMAAVALIQTLLFISVGNGILGIKCLFAEWWLILFVTAMLASLTGLILSQWLRSAVAIYITIPILLIPQILLCGLVVNFQDLTPNSRTANVPVIGDFIPSRWAFEALAVTFFMDNDYEKSLFEFEKKKYEAMYYHRLYLPELKSQLETMNDRNLKGENSDANMDVLRKSLPVLLERSGLDPSFHGEWTYEHLSRYLERIDKILTKASTHAADMADLMIYKMIDKVGKDGVVQLKKDNYNLQLEKYVVNADTQRKLINVQGSLVPRYGYIYLDPLSRNGRAPFYSSVKLIGNLRFKTLEFNLFIMFLMCMACIEILVLNFPGRKQAGNRHRNPNLT